jgi:dipeptidyl aminopeptidase/acylaminoacyl peptidase
VKRSAKWFHALLLVTALVPFTVLAQAGKPASKTAAPAAPIVPQSLSKEMPFSGPGWQDAIINQEGYVAPPKEIADAVLAKRYLNVSLTNLSPDKKWSLFQVGDGPVVMKTFSKPFDELGGLFIDFKANRVRTLTISNGVGIDVISTTDGTRKSIALPAGTRVSNPTWTPDGKNIAFFVHADTGTTIWFADAITLATRQVTKTPVLATMVSSFSFSNDGKQLFTVMAPDGRAPRPAEPETPGGPEVKVLSGKKEQNRTYPSLMSTPYHFALLEWHATGQLASVDTTTGAVTKIGAPAMITGVNPSPDGLYVRVTRMTKPFSYLVPVSSFGNVEEVWDRTGTSLTQLSERKINLGTAAADPAVDPADQAAGGRGGAAQTGKREIAWRSDGAGLSYIEQEPAPAAPGNGNGAAGGGRGVGRAGGGAAGQGGAATAPQRKDRLYQWLPPFTADSAKMLYENPTRMTGVRYSPDSTMIFWRETQGQNSMDYVVNLANTAEKFTLARFRTDDLQANPGTLASVRGGGGGRAGGGGGRAGGGGGGGAVLLSADKSAVFYEGTLNDKNPQDVGPKTFVDRFVIKTGEKTRIFESSNDGVFESVVAILDPDAKKFIVAKESPTVVEQSYLVTDGGTRTTLTKNVDPAEDLTAAVRERFYVTRPDGFKFKVNVTLPPGTKPNAKLPAIFWFYPAEFTSQEQYDTPDRTFNKNAFRDFNARSAAYFIRLGYAVVEPDAPIVGPAGQMNNNYENDLRNDLATTIDELDRRGLVDRQRLAIGGHSYGAFSTVNAMVHTPFFKAGIAGDGNYNRTLTPMGFQNERRLLWEAPQVYMAMSPFMHANNLTGALLMYHNLHDQNVGTDPSNSIRLLHALQGLGKTASLYMYPFEDHGQVAKETLLDNWARWGAWLDKYVKNPAPIDAPKPATRAGGGGN